MKVYLYIGYADPNDAKYEPITLNEKTFNSVYGEIEKSIKQPAGTCMVRLHSRLLHAIIDNDYVFIYVNPGEIADMYC